jgi:EmrB/QacA subfamily drug resistance transporter
MGLPVDVQPTTTRRFTMASMEPDDVYARRWLVLGVLCLSLVIVVVGNTALNVVLPRLVADLDASATQLQWITDAYALVFAGLLLPAGALGDRFGRKGALQLGLAVVGFAALSSTFATTATQLIATRALMGLGAAFVMPSTLSILANVFPPQERARAIAIWAGFAGAGGAIGPIISGALLDHFWWGSVFLVNVPIVAVALLAGALLVPTSSDPNHGRLDPIGALLSMVSLGALLYAIIQAPVNGWASASTIGGFAIFAAGVAAFIVWESRIEHPMLPLEYFKNRRFSVGSSTITLTFFVMFGLFFVLTQYLQFVQGFSPLTAGVATLPLAVMMIIIAPRSAALVVRFGQHRVQAAGLSMVAVGLVVLSTLTPSSSYLVVAVGLALLGAGVACTTAPATNAIISSVPLAKAGVGSAVNDTTREVGGALGIAVLGSVVNSAYRATMIDHLGGLPLKESAMAGDNVGGAIRAAHGLAPERATQLVNAASNAYTDSMRVALLVAAGVAVLAAGIVYLLFPRGPAPTMGPGHGAPAAAGTESEGSSAR